MVVPKARPLVAVEGHIGRGEPVRPGRRGHACIVAYAGCPPALAGPREGARSFGWGSCLVHTGVATGEGDADLGWCDHGSADALCGTLGLRPRVKPTTGIGRNTPTFTEVGDVSMHQLLQWARVAVVLAIVLAAASCSRLSRTVLGCGDQEVKQTRLAAEEVAAHWGGLAPDTLYVTDECSGGGRPVFSFKVVDWDSYREGVGRYCGAVRQPNGVLGVSRCFVGEYGLILIRTEQVTEPAEFEVAGGPEDSTWQW